MTALRDMTAEQEECIMKLLQRYCQPACSCKLVYQRVDGQRTGSVILSFSAIGKAIKGNFKHSFTIDQYGNYKIKTQYKGVA